MLGIEAREPGRGRAVRASAWPVVVALAVIAVLTVAGCADPGSGGSGSVRPSDQTASTSGGAGDQTGSTSGDAGEQLAGRTFLSTSVDGHELVSGSTVRIEFTQGGEIRASAGCNSMSGPAEWDGDRVSVEQLAGTEMGCEKALMEQDEWLSRLLGSGLRVELDGAALTLMADGATLHLTDRRVADPDRPLEGTTWILDGIIAGTGPSASVSSVPQGITATLRIADGKIHFFDGLNDSDGPGGADGTVVIGPGIVRIHGDIFTSAVGCASGRTCSVDMSLLKQDFHYRIIADHLTVTGTGDMADRGLMFEAQAGTAGTSSTPPHMTASPVPPPGTTSSGTGPRSPASTAPVAPPGSASDLTSSGSPRPSTLGRHDSIPPQPTPASAPESPPR